MTADKQPGALELIGRGLDQLATGVLEHPNLPDLLTKVGHIIAARYGTAGGEDLPAPAFEQLDRWHALSEQQRQQMVDLLRDNDPAIPAYEVAAALLEALGPEALGRQ